MLSDGKQIGRSLIEMIGVLAIVGVLSVGGIAGYSAAMDKLKLNKYATDINIMVMNYKLLTINEKTITSIKNKYYVPEGLYADYNKYVNATTFTDKFGNMWGNNTSGMYVRIGGNVASEARKTAIDKTCSLIIHTLRDAQVTTLSLSHTSGSVKICNESSCNYKFNQLTMEKTKEICNIILNAQNANAIIYIY